MERNPKIVVVVFGILAWLPRIVGFGADPVRGIVEIAGSMIGAWVVVSCVLKISVWLKTKDVVNEVN